MPSSLPPASDSPSLTQMWQRTSLALTACALAVVVCYFWVDRAVAEYVYQHHWAKVGPWKLLTLPPPQVQTWSPLVLTLLLLSRAWRPWGKCELAIFTACLSLILADEFRTSLGELCGRYWPETWHDNNPSFIGTGQYGFHPFQLGDDVGSFPSGHSARIVGFLGVFWILIPRARWLYVLIGAPMLFALVAMNYHFVSDVIAGSTLGGIVAAWACWLAGNGAKSG